MSGHGSGDAGGIRSPIVVDSAGSGSRTAAQFRPVEKRTGADLLSGVAAYGLWGLMPLYFKLVRAVPPAEMVAHRIVWVSVLMVLLLTVLGRWPVFFRCLASKRLLVVLSISSLLLAANWLIYIVSVVTGRIVEASLGYFINPLFSVVLGIVFFRERPRPLKTAAIL